MQNNSTKKVIASVIMKDRKILIAQRGKKDPLYGKWEFPGGKMEDNETEKECLARELYEEFGIHATVDSYICSSFFEHKGQSMEMKAYFIYEYSGEIILTEHLAMRWVNKEELVSYDMPDPDEPIVEKLLTLL